MNSISRRRFLSHSAAAAALAHTPGMAFSQNIATSAPFSDYKALVCVFLFGGNDSFNMVVPSSQAEYNAYAASRQNLAIDQSALLPISPLTSNGASYGLHPSLGGLQNLFDAGNAAIVSNVGPLVMPTTKQQFQEQSVTLPPQLFSHNDQQDQWHTLRGNAPSNSGWAGRVADVLQAGITGQTLPTNMSLFGNTLFQAADDSIAYVMGPNGPVPFTGFGDDGLLLAQKQAFESIIGQSYNSVYERAFADIQQRAVSTADSVTDAIADAPTLATSFPTSSLGTQLRTAARLIAVRESLGMERQIIFVATGGFDSHDDQNENQPGLLGNIGDSLAAFHDATVELGVANQVTTFTQSDFARTLTSNGDGTDHAWGGIQVVSGGAVNGREIYGDYPSLELGSDVDVGGGRMIPTTSSDQYAATLARWFGVNDNELDLVAPNIGNFAQSDLGFMS